MNTNIRRQKRMVIGHWSLVIGFLFFLLVTDSYASDLKIGRMKVSVMPEYESQDVLVVYEGKFADKDAFPNQVLFTLPKGVTKLTDVCSLSPGGQHFCQLYNIIDKGEYNETSVKLPYSDFFIDFKYSPFEIKSGKFVRDFEYIIKSIYPIDILEVSIQEPLRTKDFELLPKPLNKVSKKDLNYYNYTLKDVKQGQDIKFKIKYIKEDNRPSVDIKFSAMSKQELIERKRGLWLLGAGIAAIITFVVIRRLKD
ncbi:MAG: hypothetical protein AAB257_08525 [Nitrospinota bacterium]